MPWSSPYGELTQVPPALAHLDGSFYRTDKAKFHKLKELTDNEAPLETDIFIADALFFLHTLQNPPDTFFFYLQHQERIKGTTKRGGKKFSIRRSTKNMSQRVVRNIINFELRGALTLPFWRYSSRRYEEIQTKEGCSRVYQ